jgi:ceramide glucosyltransferase
VSLGFYTADGLPCVPVLLAAALTFAGLIQVVFGWAAVRRFRRTAPSSASHPPITVLKPLHGDEPLLEQALASFCDQRYPRFQIVFGVQAASDTAIAVVQRLRARFPAVDMELVVDGTAHGANRKVANLINMFPSARHDTLVISDSDMHADPFYLAHVADALATAGTGLVTTLYTGRPAGPGLSGQLGSAYITQSFAAGALLARGLGRQDCMGATMALRRETLMRIGGFPALSPYVADDAMLGAKVRALGQRVTLAATVPATTVAERGIAALFRHELRWARTIRAVAPFGFAVSIIQYPAFWALLTVAMSAAAPWTLLLLLAAAMFRAIAGRDIETVMGAPRTPVWLPPLRDVMSVAVLLAAYAGDEVAWRGHVLNTQEDTHYAAAHHTPVSPGLASGKG